MTTETRDVPEDLVPQSGPQEEAYEEENEYMNAGRIRATEVLGAITVHGEQSPADHLAHASATGIYLLAAVLMYVAPERRSEQMDLFAQRLPEALSDLLKRERPVDDSTTEQQDSSDLGGPAGQQDGDPEAGRLS